MTRSCAMLLGALVVLAGCKGRKADLGMSDSAFVQVMSELKGVADAANVPEPVRAQRREAVLRRRGVTAAQLEALTDELNAHPQHAKMLWAAIEVKAFTKPPAR